MPQYRKRPNIVDAFQWSLPLDAPEVVKPFRDFSQQPMLADCEVCGQVLGLHGWLETPEQNYLVCRGDWVVTEQDGRRYTCRPHVFELDFEEME